MVTDQSEGGQTLSPISIEWLLHFCICMIDALLVRTTLFASFIIITINNIQWYALVVHYQTTIKITISYWGRDQRIFTRWILSMTVGWEWVGLWLMFYCYGEQNRMWLLHHNANKLNFHRHLGISPCSLRQHWNFDFGAPFDYSLFYLW